MNRVNEQRQGRGIPEVEMRIGINEGEAIVRTVGSQKRAKDRVVRGEKIGSGEALCPWHTIKRPRATNALNIRPISKNVA